MNTKLGPGGGPTLVPMLKSLSSGPKRGVRTPCPPPPSAKAMTCMHYVCMPRMHVNYYCDKWNLTINRNKTKIVIFSRGKVRRCPVIVLKNEPLEVVNNYVYLGVSFNYNGRFAKAISKQVSQARRALFSLLSKAVKLRLPVDIVVHLFDQLVKPILLYGCEVWGFENCTQIEVFHRQFCKRLLKLNKATSNCMVYGELGQVEIAVAIQQRMVVFWSRIILGKQSKISYIIYRLLRGMMENGTYQSKWLNSVKATVNECGNQNLWSDESVASCEWVKLSLGLKLSDIFKQKWHDEVSENRLCTNYRIFKHEHKMEKYLTLLDRGHRINLTKFRCGNHKLPVNSGRFQGRPRCERVCNLCTSNVTGDEFHYVFDCSFFDVERRSLIKPYYLRRPNTVKMEQLFNMTSAKWLTSLSNFVKIIMNTFISVTGWCSAVLALRIICGLPTYLLISFFMFMGGMFSPRLFC